MKLSRVSDKWLIYRGYVSRTYDTRIEEEEEEEDNNNNHVTTTTHKKTTNAVDCIDAEQPTSEVVIWLIWGIEAVILTYLFVFSYFSVEQIVFYFGLST